MSRQTKSYVTIRAPGPVGNAPGTKIVVDGVDIANQITDLSLRMSLDGLHTMDVTYLCHKGVQFSGEVLVRHYCGIGEEE